MNANPHRLPLSTQAQPAKADRSYRLRPQGASRILSSGFEAHTEVGPGQVLLRMGAASLNYRDLLTLQEPASEGKSLVPLSDGAGIVEAVGAGVSHWKPGDRVSPNFFPEWTGGRFSATYLGRALGGGQTDGILRERLVIEASALVAVPEHLSLAEAATLPCAGLTAWHALFERGRIKAGDTVLVQGTGGVALFGLQLASAAGARVIVTSSSDEKLARARALGAWHTINYRHTPDWDRVTLDLTDGRGVDHILELGGPDTYDRSINAIAPGGQIAQIGVLTGFASQPNILPLQFKNASINGICVGSVEQFERLNRFMAEKQLHPVIDQGFAFEQVPEAYERLRSAAHFGKLVIEF
ncbi:NAD(P)-dependent alcohol dehydrogenase [Paucibacter sp. TC2R-5]|uniref:zinc-dependent alcohol dehydrogenase family protein n=1 Tax=Paucibacter sp. TC2R-5 TaxID=2893555 RepID=UPI0021E3C876|nr:NAD(P)-dependent alcohol dehydrogenase [Paucibacter sp. TC2R-5]MCV2360212.1 NAD(P)-dependent alcohol dehydrogenase [Paucibacter sp. TC2R-5]